MKRVHCPLCIAALLLLVGCGGGSSSSPSNTASATVAASSLSYTDPAATSADWQLMKDATSTATHLVLNLVGPSNGSKYRGAGFTLQVDTTKVSIAQFKDAAGNPTGYYRDGGIFLDKQSDPTGVIEVPPTLQAGGVSKGNLMVGIYQKADDQNWSPANFQYGVPYIGTTAKDCFNVVLQVAIDFDANLHAAPGPVPLSALKAKVIPENIDTPANRKLQSVDLKVGTLTLK